MSILKTASAALVGICLAASAQAADITIRLAHLNPEDPFASHSGAMSAVFKSLVESNSNGRIEVQLFPNGQLGKDNEVIEQVRSGLVESVISSSGGMAQHYPMVGVFDFPFAFPNIGVASKVIDEDSSFGKKFVADLEGATGLEVLGLLDSGGFFAFTSGKAPIKSAADREGQRIRTMTLPTHEAMITSLGGQPTPLPWAEVYTALQTGATDGNNGRSVAWGAQNFGCGCVIFILATVSEARKEAIAAYDAEVRRCVGNYDDSVREAQETARKEGWFVVSDTTYEGYMDIPRDVMQGYVVMAAEAFDAMDVPPPHIFLQTGVGGMAAAVTAQLVRRWGASSA